MSVDRNIKSVKVYASTDNANSLKINDLTFQENMQPKENVSTYIYSPYIAYDYSIDEYIMGYDPITGIEIPANAVLTVDPTTKTGFKYAMPALYMQISIMGLVTTSDHGPPIPVPRNAVVTEIYPYVRTGSCSMSVYANGNLVTVGMALVKNDILSADVNSASSDCEDAVIQVRCV